MTKTALFILVLATATQPAAAADFFSNDDVIVLNDGGACSTTGEAGAFGTLNLHDRTGRYKSGVTVIGALVPNVVFSRVQPALFLSANENHEIDIIGTDGVRKTFFKLADSRFPRAVAVLRDGGVVVLVDESNSQRSMVRLDAQGKLVSDFSTPDFPGSPHVDVAADSCTMFFATGKNVGRYDICRRTRLADFATTDETVTDVKLLPDGGAVAASGLTLVRFAADGHVIARIPLKGFTAATVGAISLSRDANVVWTQIGFCNGPYLAAIDLTTGDYAFPPTPLSGGRLAYGVAVYGGWNAAQQYPPAPGHRRAAR